MKTRSGSYRRVARMVVPAGLALVIGIAIGWQVPSAPASAQDSVVALAETETDRFYQAVSGNGALDDVLGDAFQLIRTDGSRHDRASYLARPASVSGYVLDGFTAFQSGDVLTATFVSTNTATVEGVEHDTVGQPRLVVFSKVDGAWKLQAFANLGLGLASDVGAEARRAVDIWVSAAASGDVEVVREIIAPEFQIVRSNGAAYGAEDYLAGGLPKIEAIIEIDDVVATGFGDHMIVRYHINVEETVAGGQIKGRAPRMTVFRRSGDDWLVVAHANFARVEG